MPSNQVPIAIPATSVVVVSWNTESLLRTCLDSLAICWPGADVEVVVVDNASADGSASMVKAEHPEALLLQAETNLGYAKAINRGIQRCTADFVCLLNSDTEVLPGSLETLIDFLRARPDVGLVGPTLLYPDGTFQSSRRSFPFFVPSLLRPFQHSNRGLPSGPSEADWLVGACLALPRKLLETLRGMDESYPFYGEDMDLAYRIRLRGLKVVQLPKALVYHLGEASSGPNLSPLMRVRSHYEAPLRFLRKHASKREVMLWRLVRGTVAALRYGSVRLRRGTDSEYQRAIWSMVIRLCVRGAPSDWALATSR